MEIKFCQIYKQEMVNKVNLSNNLIDISSFLSVY